MKIDPEESVPLPGANVRAARYYIARTHVRCTNCSAVTPLTALALAPSHETLDEDAGEWQAVAANAFLFHLEAISPAVHARLRRAAPNLCFDSCWVNFCERCERILSDDEVHGEPGRGFTPLGEKEASEIVLTEIAEPFEALASGYSLEPDFFSEMRRG